MKDGPSQSGLHDKKFQASQSYRVTTCSNKTNNKTNKNPPKRVTLDNGIEPRFN